MVWHPSLGPALSPGSSLHAAGPQPEPLGCKGQRSPEAAAGAGVSDPHGDPGKSAERMRASEPAHHWGKQRAWGPQNLPMEKGDGPLGQVFPLLSYQALGQRALPF